MATIKTKGIIIKRINLGEADKILTILTADRGKIRVIAKGMRKPNAKLGGFLELFRYNDYMLAEGRNLDLVTGASTIESFRQISLSLHRLGLAYYVAELIDKLVEETQDADTIFDLTHSVFREINQQKLPIDLIKSFFELNLLSILGLRPELDKCIVCNKLIDEQAKFGFSWVLGGVLDGEHLTNDHHVVGLNKNELDLLRCLVANPCKSLQMNQSYVDDIPKITRLTNSLMEYALERQLRSRNFLEEVLQF
ncbi:TPA: DNA repair protein RecO [Patescibacteria group bacterium]|nr:DNA repair protein RecO [Patescibacteria group bacterium]